MARKKNQETFETITDVRKFLQKKYGKECITLHEEVHPVPTISTGIPTLDRALGGGIAQGRMTEVSGENSSGKTTIVLSIAAQAQKQFPDKYVAFIDAEHALDIQWAEKLGVDFSRFEHLEPDLGEDAMEMVEVYLSTGKCSVLILDSVAALMPASESNKDIGEANIGAQARLIASAIRRLNRMLNKHPESSLIFINQHRAQLQGGGKSFNYEFSKTTGGRALPFYMTTRLPVRVVERLTDSNKKMIGQRVLVDVKKHKVNAGPGDKIYFRISNKHGIDIAHDVLEAALEEGLATKSGSWYVFDENNKVQGEENAKDFIRQNLNEWLPILENYHVKETEEEETET